MRNTDGRTRTRINIPTCRSWWVVAISCVFLLIQPALTQNLSPDDVKPPIAVKLSADRVRFHPGEDIRLRVEIWNEGDQDLFIFKTIDASSNALTTLHLSMYQGDRVVGPTMSIVSDSFSGYRSAYPPLESELPRYWVALPPHHFYGGEIVMKSSWFAKLMVPGRYKIEGKYSSRGFLAQDVNNPLAHYAEELEQLPYKAWVGSVETNSVWIEIARVVK
jgi:hypothetical protein